MSKTIRIICIGISVLSLGLIILVASLIMSWGSVEVLYEAHPVNIKPTAIKENLKHGILWEKHKGE